MTPTNPPAPKRRVRSPGTELRLSTLERGLEDHARSLSEIVNSVRNLASSIEPLRPLPDRITAMEEWQVNRRVVEAHEEERDKALYERLDRIEKSLNEANARRNGLWLELAKMAMGPIVTAVVIGVAAMVLQAAQHGALP